jgi:hypothetical protein
MNSQDPGSVTRRFSVMESAPHSLHECRTVDEFNRNFEAATGQPAQQIVAHVVSPTAPRAVFLVGSIPLGMATHGSDIDVIVLVDQRESLLDPSGNSLRNTDQRAAFYSDSDLLRAGEFLTVVNGLTVDVTAVITSGVKRIHARLRTKGPELSESEILTLGRLSTGWLLFESDRYLERSTLTLKDPALDIYCSTKHFVAARAFLSKGSKALDLLDVNLALHLARASVEAGYLAYYASEGLSYLGAKWPAQIGLAHGAEARLQRHPLLRDGIPLLFPAFPSHPKAAAEYLHTVADFLASLRSLIERKILFRIAFMACPQITSA